MGDYQVGSMKVTWFEVLLFISALKVSHGPVFVFSLELKLSQKVMVLAECSNFTIIVHYIIKQLPI